MCSFGGRPGPGLRNTAIEVNGYWQLNKIIQKWEKNILWMSMATINCLVNKKQ